MSASAPLKMALVGCGGIARAHLRGLEEHVPQIKITAAIDADADRAREMADKTGAQPFDSLDKALQSGDFDAVDIMLPHDLHEEAAVACFKAGKHVVLEKPMAPTLDACTRIRQAAAAAGTVFMVAEQSQYWPDALKVRQMLRQGAIGDLITARAYFGGRVGSGWGGKPWRYELARAGGGIVIDGGAHWLRPLRMWLGEVDEVVAVTGRPLEAMEGESLCRALLRFESGTVALFDAMRAGSFIGPGEEFRLTGTTGELLVEKGAHGRLLHYSKETPEGKDLMEGVNKGAGRDAAFGYELLDFARAVLEGKPLEASPEYSLGELRTGLAIYRSAASKRWEKVWD